MTSKTMLLTATLSFLVACGGGNQEQPKTAAAPKSNMPPATQPAAEPVQLTAATLTRTQVKTTVQEGLGVFLQNVDLDDHAVFESGKFHGFRVLALRDGPAKSGLLAGDVVTSVNRMPIERPEQALAAFRSLETANELRVDYERNGEPKTLTIPIVDDKK
jgi:S1-C subfamily serine protease